MDEEIRLKQSEILDKQNLLTSKDQEISLQEAIIDQKEDAIITLDTLIE